MLPVDGATIVPVKVAPARSAFRASAAMRAVSSAVMLVRVEHICGLTGRSLRCNAVGDCRGKVGVVTDCSCNLVEGVEQTRSTIDKSWWRQ